MIQHPKILPILTGEPFPLASISAVFLELAQKVASDAKVPLEVEDRILTVAMVGLGPVAIVSAGLQASSLPYDLI